ncbi:DsbC family protein [Methylophilaceae bacterium]|jgi:thiol:disulfide interchange protein DsbC|nr:DsbC family protein [Methylophilaceae bacterium]
MLKTILYVFLLCVFNLHANESDLKKLIEQQYPDIKIQSIKKTNFNDLYEVFLGNEIIYTDKSFKFLIIEGQLVDPKTKKNITADRLAEYQKIDFSDLPLDLAIKIKKGKGQKKVAVFSDLDCPFCRKLEKDVLLGLDDVEIYTFIFPLAIHPEAEQKSLQIWCSDDPSTNWVKFMKNAELPDNKGDCSSPIKEITAFAKKNGIQSTPTIIFEDGRRVSGAIPLDQFKSLL